MVDLFDGKYARLAGDGTLSQQLAYQAFNTPPPRINLPYAYLDGYMNEFKMRVWEEARLDPVAVCRRALTAALSMCDPQCHMSVHEVNSLDKARVLTEFVLRPDDTDDTLTTILIREHTRSNDTTTIKAAFRRDTMVSCTLLATPDTVPKELENGDAVCDAFMRLAAGSYCKNNKRPRDVMFLDLAANLASKMCAHDGDVYDVSPSFLAFLDLGRANDVPPKGYTAGHFTDHLSL